MRLDLAVAPRTLAEAAFFETDDDAGIADEIPRISLEGLSDFELAHLGMQLTGAFEPQLVLDSPFAEDIVTELDPALVRALAALADVAIEATARRWQLVLADSNASPPELVRLHSAVIALAELARLAVARRHALLYTQTMEDFPSEPDFD